MRRKIQRWVQMIKKKTEKEKGKEKEQKVNK